jgi:hypothetical protein
MKKEGICMKNETGTNIETNRYKKQIHSKNVGPPQ